MRREVALPNKPWLERFEHATVGGQHLIRADSLAVLRLIPSRTVDLVLTSPPYNLGIKYASYQDNLQFTAYLQWVSSWLSQVRRILKNDGSLFLNVAGSSTKPLVPHLLLMETINCGFVLQNDITWVKSIYVPNAVHVNGRDVQKPGHTFGHHKPVNSPRYLTRTNESIFHLTNGETVIDKLAIGVEYSDPANSRRWKNGAGKRAADNTWFIPYPTRKGKAEHPATFPVELPVRCMKLHFGDRMGGFVLDPFSGVGTTGVAAFRLGHQSIGIELDAGYHQKAVDRVRGEAEVDPRRRSSGGLDDAA